MRIVRLTCTFALTLGLSTALVAAEDKTKAAGAPKADAGSAGKLVFTTKSPEAKAAALDVIHRIETFQFGPALQESAKKAITADPSFAFGHYLMGVTTFPAAQAKPHLDKAAELMKTASEGERRYFEAGMLNRSQKGAEALVAFEALARDFPEERMIQMMLGQIYTAQGQSDKAKAALERAIAMDGSLPRAHALVGNVHLLNEDYATARKHFDAAMKVKAPSSAPGQIYFGMAFADLYEGKVDEALKTLEIFLKEYKDTGAASGFPEVFIWNSMARINLEHGRLDAAMKNYEEGFKSVPGSTIDEQQKTIWRGRLLHGKARTLARMGKHAEAWAEAESVKKMIEGGGKDGEPFLPAYHYLAGYLKLEAGEYPAAIEHLKQAEPDDAFHVLLLARAYEKAGDKVNAQKSYEKIVASKQNNLERALAYPEARKKLRG